MILIISTLFTSLTLQSYLNQDFNYLRANPSYAYYYVQPLPQPSSHPASFSQPRQTYNEQRFNNCCYCNGTPHYSSECANYWQTQPNFHCNYNLIQNNTVGSLATRQMNVELIKQICNRAFLYSRLLIDQDKLKKRLETLLENPKINEKITKNFSEEEVKTLFNKWLEKEKSHLRLNVDKQAIEKVSKIILETFQNDVKNLALFLGYTCFLTKIYTKFNDKCKKVSDLLTVQGSLESFNSEHLTNAAQKWKGLKIQYDSIKEGFWEMMKAREVLDPSWERYSIRKIYTASKITTLLCLMHFFLPEQTN
ncbi:hypothetical protein TUBRATIS_13560 [Tubulinosema ratisbonensis]|uniref:Uncharacterized protein n=1 Tax=Tubulinosema ratisbonensis TaxID=291195 RepID=A0A437AM20_9MICR|nr:hypothetical protein TUBRATIS_13560 [Tubulinosema ratisbonensis]